MSDFYLETHEPRSTDGAPRLRQAILEKPQMSLGSVNRGNMVLLHEELQRLTRTLDPLTP
jgi:hypothetical protein